MNTPAKYSELQPASWRRHRTHSRLSEELFSITTPIVHKLYGNYLNAIATYTRSPASSTMKPVSVAVEHFLSMPH